MNRGVRASVLGSLGRLEIGAPLFGPTSITFTSGSIGAEDSASWVDNRFEVLHDGLGDQATAFASFVGEGRTESPVHMHDDITGTMHVIDVARARIASASAVTA